MTASPPAQEPATAEMLERLYRRMTVAELTEVGTTELRLALREHEQACGIKDCFEHITLRAELSRRRVADARAIVAQR